VAVMVLLVPVQVMFVAGVTYTLLLVKFE